MSKELIRSAGGIVHSDGNIFFTNQKMLDAYVAAIAQPAKASALNKLLFKIEGFAGSGMIPWQIEDAYADYVAAIAASKGAA